MHNCFHIQYIQRKRIRKGGKGYIIYLKISLRTVVKQGRELWVRFRIKPNSGSIVCWIVELKAALHFFTREKKYFAPPSVNWIRNRRIYSPTHSSLRHRGLIWLISLGQIQLEDQFRKYRTDWHAHLSFYHPILCRTCSKITYKLLQNNLLQTFCFTHN